MTDKLAEVECGKYIIYCFSDANGFYVPIEQYSDVMHPNSIPYRLGSTEFYRSFSLPRVTIAVEGVEISFSMDDAGEMYACQVDIGEDLSEDIIRRILDEVVGNIIAATGQKCAWREDKGPGKYDQFIIIGLMAILCSFGGICMGLFYLAIYYAEKAFKWMFL